MNLFSLPDTFRAIAKAALVMLSLSGAGTPAVLSSSPRVLDASRGVRTVFVGDMMFDRYIRKVASKKGDDFILSCADDVLKGADVAVGNLEGPITKNPSVSIRTKSDMPGHFTFTFPLSVAAALARHNIGIVNLGNNHIGNYGTEGIKETKAYLDAAGVSYFGGLAGSEPVARRGKISFVSYNQFGGASAQKVAQTIAGESAAGQEVVVYAHWGEEYTQDVSRLRPLAELFVKNGAKAVLGSHPHVVMKKETLLGAPVYYSLGNFVFDQYWSPETMQGLAVALTYKDGAFTPTEYEVKMSPDGSTCATTLASR